MLPVLSKVGPEGIIYEGIVIHDLGHNIVYKCHIFGKVIPFQCDLNNLLAS